MSNKINQMNNQRGFLSISISQVPCLPRALSCKLSFKVSLILGKTNSTYELSRYWELMNKTQNKKLRHKGHQKINWGRLVLLFNLSKGHSKSTVHNRGSCRKEIFLNRDFKARVFYTNHYYLLGNLIVNVMNSS
jgi:hypothetical protein